MGNWGCSNAETTSFALTLLFALSYVDSNESLV